MTCPSCGHAGQGVECERCGHELERSCPGCQTRFTRACRFCRQCGRDLFFVNYSRRRRLRFPVNVVPEAYEYPPDRQGLKLLQRTGPLRELTRLFIRQVSEPMFHGQLLGTAVKVSERQFPLIHRQAAICERILNLSPVNIFVGTSPGQMSAVTAFTYGTEDSACIFLSSALVDSLSEDELRFVIGHEMGHIKSRHVLYLTIAHMISLGLSTITSVVSQVLVQMLGQVLQPWQRKAEITADRAGLLCCQSVHTAVSTMIKVSLGARPKLFEQVDLEEYLKQAETLKTKYKWSESQETHPYVIHRVNYLKDFAAGSEYRQLLDAAYDPAVPKILCPKCHSHEYLTDRERPLGEMQCSACQAPLNLTGMFCPHCHAWVKLADPKTTLATFRCKPAPDEGADRKIGLQYCGRAYHDGPPSQPGQPESHYDVLGLPESASEGDIERAYLAIVKPTLKAHRGEGAQITFDAITRRLKAHRAYQVLTNRHLRDQYNQRLALLRALHRDSAALGLPDAPEKLPDCVRCEAPVYGPHCTQCGANQEEAKKEIEAEKAMAAGFTPDEAKKEEPAKDATDAKSESEAEDTGITFTSSTDPDDDLPNGPAPPTSSTATDTYTSSRFDPNVISASDAIAPEDPSES